MKKKCGSMLVVVSVCMMVVSVIFAGLFQSDFGRVEITDIQLQTDVGVLTGYLFVPDHEDGEKLPAIVTSHGYLNNREMQGINFVEFARNGYVVFAMNAYGHGDSSVVLGEKAKTINAESGGMVDAVEYISGLPFVDTNAIGVTGHSMGGGFTNTTMEYYSNLEKEALANGLSAAEAKKYNKINSGVIVGNFPANMLAYESDGNSGYLCDVGVVAGMYDEFFLGMTGGVFARDLMESDNLKKVVKVQTNNDIAKVEEGVKYVDSNTGYSFTIYMPKEFHAWNHFSATTVDNLVRFFNDTLKDSDAEPTFQVWFIKEVFNFIGLIGMFMFIVPFAKILLKIPFFASVVSTNSVKAITPLKESKKTGRYITTNIVNSIIAAILLLPVMGIGYFLIQSNFFPQDTTGGIGLWSAVCGLFALLFFRINTGSFKGRGEELGIKVSICNWLKILLLSIIVVATTYSFVFIADYIAQVDFRFWTWVARIFTFDKLLIAIRYLPFFAVFYIINSLCLSQNNFANWSETKQILISVLFNILGTSLFVAITYIPTIFMDITLWNAIPNPLVQMAGALVPILAIPIIPTLAVAAFVNVKLYKATGNIWLGGLVNTILITLMTVANTSFSHMY